MGKKTTREIERAGRERDKGRRGSEKEREGGRGRELLPLGECGSRPGQIRLILVSVWRPAELAPGTVKIHW